MIQIYDTTLRDGTQREGISLSCDDKVRIARRLDALGVAFIEGGWPGSTPKDAGCLAACGLSIGPCWPRSNSDRARGERAPTTAAALSSPSSVRRSASRGSAVLRSIGIVLVQPSATGESDKLWPKTN